MTKARQNVAFSEQSGDNSKEMTIFAVQIKNISVSIQTYNAMPSSSFPSDVHSICYLDTDLMPLREHPYHFRCGFYLVCTQGRALVSTGVQQYVFDEQTELIFLTGSLLEVLDTTPDFHARALFFPQEVFLKAILPIDTPYFNYTHEHPCYRHTPDERSQKTWREMLLWMDMARMLFAENQSTFQPQHEHNFLQSLLMWLFNTIPDKQAATGIQYNRKQQLCHRFMQLVREHSSQEHLVPFYATRLCITPRYLYEATTQYLDGKSPKQLIDEQLVAEIEVLLNNPTLSITGIAAQLNFADQSCLSRFFKKQTGLSPKEYREQRI